MVLTSNHDNIKHVRIKRVEDGISYSAPKFPNGRTLRQVVPVSHRPEGLTTEMGQPNYEITHALLFPVLGTS